MGDVGPEISAPLADALARLSAAKTMRPPNQPIAGYAIPHPAILDSFIGRLERAGRDLLAYETAAIRETLALPILEGDPPIREHLAVYEQIAELRAALQTLYDKTVVAGFGRLAALSVPKADVADELKVLTATVARLSEEVSRLGKRDFGGVAFSLGFMSVDMKSMQAGLQRLSAAIRRDKDQVDAAEIWSVSMELTRIAVGLQLRANELGASLDERLEQWISRVVEATRVLMETARAILKKAVAKRRADLDAAREVVAAAILRKIPRFDMAVDLGSSMTRIWIRGKGAVLVEPTVVALRNVGGRQIVHAVGTTAAQMIGRTPEHMETVHPLSGGSVVDFEVAEAMLGVFLKQVNNRRKVPSGRLLATVPTLGPEVHRRAVSELCSGAGAPRPVLIERGIAATAGAGTPIADTEPTLVVCIGGGATEICTFSKSRLVSVRSTTRAGQFIDDEIMNALRAEHGMLISAATAERIKQDLSNGEPMDHMQVRGRDLRQGVPRDVSFSSSRILQGLSSVQAIAVDVKDALDTMPAETRAAVSCIHLVGGGALFPPIAVAIGSVTGLKVVLANDPAAVTIGGCGAFVEGTGPLETWNARIG